MKTTIKEYADIGLIEAKIFTSGKDEYKKVMWLMGLLNE